MKDPRNEIVKGDFVTLTTGKKAEIIEQEFPGMAGETMTLLCVKYRNGLYPVNHFRPYFRPRDTDWITRREMELLEENHQNAINAVI